MSNGDKYYELEELVTSLESIIDDLTIKDYIYELEETIRNAKNEMQELEEELRKEAEEERKYMVSEYERSVL